MSDLIDRQAAIDMFQNLAYDDWNQGVSTTWANAYSEAAEMIRDLPSAQPLSAWGGNPLNIDLPSAQRTGRWIWDDEGYHCSECWHHTYGNTGEVLSGIYKFCPSCGAQMEVEE